MGALMKHNEEAFTKTKRRGSQYVVYEGSIGTGKSRAIDNMLTWIRNEGHQVLVYDKGFSLGNTFFTKNADKLSSPAHARAENWPHWKDGTSNVPGSDETYAGTHDTSPALWESRDVID